MDIEKLKQRITEFEKKNRDLIRENEELKQLLDANGKGKILQELHQSRELFSKAFLNGPLLMSISAIEDGRYLEVNDRFLKTLGFSKKEVIGKTSTEIGFISEKERKLLIGSLEKEGKVSNLEFEIKKKNGEKIWCRYFGEIIIDDGEERLLSIAIDVTDQKAAREELLLSEKKFRQFFESAGDAIIITGAKTRVVDVNPAFTEITGISRDDMIGKTGFDLARKFAGKASLPVLWKALKNLTLGKSIEKFEINFKGKILEISTAIRRNRDYNISILRDITETRNAENALQESEERFRFLSDVTFEGIVIHKDGVVLDVNKSFEFITGYSKKEAVGQNLFKNIVSREDFKKASEKVKQDHAKPYQVKARRKDGAVIIAEIEGRDVVFRGEKVRIVAIRDITEKVKAQESIIESEQKLQEAQAIGKIGSYETDLTTGYWKGSVQFCKMFGFEPDQKYTQEEFAGIVHPEDREKVLNYFQECLEQKKDFNYEYRTINRLTRETIYVRSVSKVFYDHDGKPLKVFGTKQNITNRILAEKDIRESEEKFRAIFNESPIGIEIYRSDGLQINANPASLEMFGISSFSEVERFNIFDGTSLSEENKSKLRNGEAIRYQATFDFEKVKSMGQYDSSKTGTAEFDYIITPLHGSENEIAGYMLMVQDITRRKRIERELILAKEKAEESDRLKSAFLANMSHEIRTPMNGILGFADLLKEPGLSGEDQRQYINVIEKSGERMLNIINDLINISKIEAGQVEISTSETNVNWQMSYLHDFFKPEAEKKGLQIKMICSLPDTESSIYTDGEKLYAILTNLIKNALKYTDTGSVKFGYYPKNGFMEFFVIDSGTGIPEDRQKDVFERFSRAHSFSDGTYEGAGLGLAICKAYVELLGGRIWVKSKAGKGSSFYFSIPVNKNKIKEMEQQSKNKGISKAGNSDLVLLIAEDDQSALDYLELLMQKQSKKIFSAKSGQEVIDKLQANPDIDLILMDIKMPGMNGYDATRKIREFNQDVVIIAQTAFALEGDREKAIEAGCNDYIAKPIKRSELSEIISKYFE
ncbi:MAG: PAS domain S-box protein [Bacteroidales bacterium]|nr:PAS domain S-box protein [Bacteroidales bacterium]MCF8396691.1 PAS domain S-box protein [Bacteroidales bacterium]